jgi:hypothetical protein
MCTNLEYTDLEYANLKYTNLEYTNLEPAATSTLLSSRTGTLEGPVSIVFEPKSGSVRWLVRRPLEACPCVIDERSWIEPALFDVDSHFLNGENKIRF